MKKRVHVVSPEKKFLEIEDDSDEYQVEKTSEEEGEEDDQLVDEEEEEEDVPPPRKRITGKKSGGKAAALGSAYADLYDPPCRKCQKTARDCERGPGGGSCLSCKAKKYGCEYASHKKRLREEEEDEEDVRVVKVKPSKKKSEVRVKTEPAPKKVTPAKARRKAPAAKKGKAKVTPKGVEVVDESDDEEHGDDGGVEGESEEEEPKPRMKRARTRTYLDRGKCRKNKVTTDLTFLYRNKLAARTIGGPGC
jgi:hypothetical protein